MAWVFSQPDGLRLVGLPHGSERKSSRRLVGSDNLLVTLPQKFHVVSAAVCWWSKSLRPAQFQGEGNQTSLLFGNSSKESGTIFNLPQALSIGPGHKNEKIAIFSFSSVPVSGMDWKWDSGCWEISKGGPWHGPEWVNENRYLKSINANWSFARRLARTWWLIEYGGWGRGQKGPCCFGPARDHAQKRNLGWKSFPHTLTHREVPGLSRRRRNLRSLEKISVYNWVEWMDGWMVGTEPKREGRDKQVVWAWRAVRFSQQTGGFWWHWIYLHLGTVWRKECGGNLGEAKEQRGADSWEMRPAQGFTFVISLHPHCEMRSINAIIQMRKMKPREVKWLAQGCTSGNWKYLDSNPGLCDFKVTSGLHKGFPWLGGTIALRSAPSSP